MASLQIRDMTAKDERFVASCTHVGETAEWDASCQRRIPWLREMQEQGMRIKVALLDGQHAGFLYLLPIEIAPAGPVGKDLSVIQCLAVRDELKGHGVGHALIAAAEEEAQRQGRKGIVVTGFCHDFWFMPAPFFEECGFTVARRKGDTAILWKTFDDSAETPAFTERRYRFTPVEGVVVIDLFWSRSCLTTDTEAQRVREVAAELGDAVLLCEHCADDPAVRARYGVYRAILIDGQEVGWGYEAPRNGLREAIRKAMETNAQLTTFIETAEFFIAKLRRYTTGVDIEEMQWTPAGIANSLAWIVRHCADLLWLGYGRLAGERVPVNLGGSGIAWSAVKGATFDEAAQEPGPDAQERMAYLERAWQTLKTYLQNHADWEEVELVVERRRRSAWTFLQHNLGDLCYHTGQASYLRKLLAAERRRARARRRRAEKARR